MPCREVHTEAKARQEWMILLEIDGKYCPEKRGRFTLEGPFPDKAQEELMDWVKRWVCPKEES